MGKSVSRRFFLAGLGAAALPASSRATPAVPPRTTNLLRCPIAGLAYYAYPRLTGRLAAGAAVILQREPANPYDARAIAVLTTDGAKLGYVPRASNAPLTGLMDAGYELRAEIVKSDRKDWWPLWIAVTLVDGGTTGGTITS